MPKLDGYEVARRLKSKPQFSNTVIVMLSRHDGVIDRLKGRLAGAKEYISNPLKTQDIIFVVESYVGVSACAKLTCRGKWRSSARRGPNLSRSEMAQLRQRIEDEITSMYLLMNGPAVVGKHTIITHKYRNLGAYHQELAKLVGEQPAEMIVNETYYQIMEGDQNATTQSETDHQIITTTQDHPGNG